MYTQGSPGSQRLSNMRYLWLLAALALLAVSSASARACQGDECEGIEIEEYVAAPKQVKAKKNTESDTKQAKPSTEEVAKIQDENINALYLKHAALELVTLADRYVPVHEKCAPLVRHARMSIIRLNSILAQGPEALVEYHNGSVKNTEEEAKQLGCEKDHKAIWSAVAQLLNAIADVMPRVAQK